MTDVEFEIQRLMLERLGIEWTPGEPFYSLVEAEIERLRAERERLRAALLKIADDSAHADQYVRWAQEALDAPQP